LLCRDVSAAKGENEEMKLRKGEMEDRSGRRGFLKRAGAGLVLATAERTFAQAPATKPEALTQAGVTRPLTDAEKVKRIASNSYPIRFNFKTRNPTESEQKSETAKKKYGEITLLDYPDFTKEHFPGVTQMDVWSSLFGDPGDDSMYVRTSFIEAGGKYHDAWEFDPSAAASKKWLEKLASKCISTGTQMHHISNNAPRNICDLDVEKRRHGIEVAKKWLDGAATLGVKSMRVNSGGPRIAPTPIADPSSYPKNDQISVYLTNCIESFKEMADYGGKRGVKVTLENHWGLTANPINIKIVIEEVNHPFCEASPDFCNWEHEYLLFHALNDLAPYAHTNVHAKYWDRWKNPDVQRNVRIMLNNGYMGVFALEYEDGPWDGVEGAKYLYREVMAAL
jgi:sugar phosphate isomerase/epimerase